MLNKLVLGGLFGGIILFVWGAFSWMALPWHMKSMHSFKDEAAVAQLLKTDAPKSGVYLLPFASEKVEGPMAFVAVSQEGMTSMVPSMIIGLIANIIAAALVTWMLMQTTGLNYIQKVGFVLVFALAGSVLTHFTYWNWFHFSASYTLVEMLDVLIAWLLAGLAIARVVSNYKRAPSR